MSRSPSVMGPLTTMMIAPTGTVIATRLPSMISRARVAF
jgi:hypothetical protein